MGDTLTCTMGLAPGKIIVIPKGPPVQMEGKFVATIMDNIPMANIVPFGMCNSPSNPAVIATTAAALGVHTPAPCIPATPAPWAPPCPTVKIGNFQAIDSSSKLTCLWAGTISPVPSATKETIP
jgi:hypothetical protein